jgi:hypothetical protein
MEQQLKYPQWQGPLQAAIVELDRVRLREKLETAEMAISKRSHELVGQADTTDELRAIADGLYIIRMLRASRLP